MLACKSGNVPTIKILIKNGALLNLKDKFGKSALVYCVNKDQIKATEFLLVHQPEVDSLDKFEWTPLMWAVKKDYFEIIKLLVAV